MAFFPKKENSLHFFKWLGIIKKNACLVHFSSVLFIKSTGKQEMLAVAGVNHS